MPLNNFIKFILDFFRNLSKKPVIKDTPVPVICKPVEIPIEIKPEIPSLPANKGFLICPIQGNDESGQPLYEVSSR